MSQSSSLAGSGMFAGRGLVLTCAALSLVVFLVFSPALRNNFIHYDDADYVTDNPHVKAGLTVAGVAWAFTTGHAANWHPLTWISHMADCELYGLKPWGHHLTNILLHSLSTVLLFLALRRMTGANWRSLIVALVFGLHPLRVESVAWLAERKDVLSTFFWMLTMLAYLRYVRESKARSPKSKVFYGLALLCFACGLMSKPMLVTLPFVLLLLDWWPLQRICDLQGEKTARPGSISPGRAALEKLPFLALAMGSSVVTFLVQQRGDVMSVDVSLILRLENAMVSYCRYLGKLFWPLDLAVFYPHPLHWPAGVIAMCGLILLVISGFAFALRKSRPYFAVGWCWFLGTLVPAIGLVQVGSQSMADRYSYVPTIGIIFIFVWGGFEFLKRVPRAKSVAVAALSAGIIGCIFLTTRQIGYWQDSETLFRHALAVTTNNPVALLNLGEAVSGRGQAEEALAYYREALRIQPGYFEAMNNIGVQLIKLQRVGEAIPVLKDALKAQDAPIAHNNLGQALSDAGDYDAAIEQFRAALKLRPDYPNAQANWGLALAGKRQVDEAIPHFQEAIRLDPYHFDAQNNLGIAYYAKGRYDNAIIQFRNALRIKPNDAGVRENLALMEAAKAGAPNSSTSDSPKR